MANKIIVNKAIALALATFTTVALMPGSVLAWGCCRSSFGYGSRGGSWSHSSATVGGYGSFSHVGSSSYTSPSGHTYSASHAGSGYYGGGSAVYHGSYSTGSGGYGSYYGGASYHGSYYGYHGCSYPTYSTGCYGSGFGAGVVVGAAATAAVVAATDHPASSVYVYPSSGVYVQPAPVVVQPLPPSTPLGTIVTVLPPGFTTQIINGTTYYQSGSTWYTMNFGPNGVYFTVVPAP